MGQKKDLYNEMRSRGVRKGVAKDVADSLAKDAKSKPKVARRAAADLSSAVVAIESEMGDKTAKRRVSARKAAATRRSKAKHRRKGAKEMAKGR